MPELPSINRVSLTKSLEQRYAETSELAVAPGDGGTRTFNAKDVGKDVSAVDAIDGTPIGQSPRDWAQKDFKIKQPVKVTQFTGDSTSGGLGYATVGLKHNNTKYAPSGRL